MKKIHIPAGSLAVLSGLPGAGKSYLLAQSRLAPGIVQSSDALRRALGGESVHYDAQGRRVHEPTQAVNVLVWETLLRTVEERLKQGLTTVVDATLVADYVPDSVGRATFAAIAQRCHVPFKVIIVGTPLERALAQNEQRAARVSPNVVNLFANGLELSSQFDHDVVDSNARIQVVSPLSLQNDKWDVVGDVHGLLEPLQDVLTQMGYAQSTDGLMRHRDGRRLLFLGDIVDRGPHSIEALEFVMRMVRAGLAHCLKGNHEDKLVRFWDKMQSGDMKDWTSYANAQSGMDLVAMKPERAAELVKFMRTLPLFATYEDERAVVAFAHADARAFNVSRSTKEDLLFGSSDWGRIDSDAAMQAYLENECIFATDPVRATEPSRRQYYVRGHIPTISEQRNVLSLDDSAYAGGTLRVLRLDAFLAGERAVHTFKTNYDYRPAQARRTQAYCELKSLLENKSVTAAIDPKTGLRLFKYAKRVFYEASWSEHEALIRARGHVYDIAGNIVSNPFDKVFNYKEEGAGLELEGETPVRAVEKLNGFLGVISPHPIHRGQLLVHTTGSFDSDFVGYIHDQLDPATKGRIAQLFSKRRLTLMFEVLHPKDPHIITYGENDFGLHLIGARQIEVGSSLLTEHELDGLAQAIGVRRPHHFETTFEQLQRENSTCRLEGYMVRLLDEAQTMVLKLKSPYYLTTKFLARMKDGNWKHLYANPESFKQRLDEEFFPLVDMVREDYDLASILELDEIGRRDLVQALVQQMLTAPAATSIDRVRERG